MVHGIILPIQGSGNFFNSKILNQKAIFYDGRQFYRLKNYQQVNNTNCFTGKYLKNINLHENPVTPKLLRFGPCLSLIIRYSY
jgi:hypothetical protein